MTLQIASDDKQLTDDPRRCMQRMLIELPKQARSRSESVEPRRTCEKTLMENSSASALGQRSRFASSGATASCTAAL